MNIIYAILIGLFFLTSTTRADKINDIFYESKTTSIKIFSCSLDLPNDNGNSIPLSYVVNYENLPRLVIQKSDQPLIFIEIPEQIALAYVKNLELYFLDLASAENRSCKINLQTLSDKIDELMPSAREGPILHEWFVDMNMVSGDSFITNYIIAKYPKKYKISIKIKLVKKDNKMTAESQIIEVNKLSWSDVTAPPTDP
jgi:hypothetical protein